MKGHISEDALEQYSRLVAERQGLDFAEGETYDFARCMRSDGTFYGTRGKCKKGKEAGDEGPKEPNTGALESQAKRASALSAETKLKSAKSKLKALERDYNSGKGGPALREALFKARRAVSKAEQEASGAREEYFGRDKEDLQKRASRGDREAMAKLVKMRSEGKIGKEPGFGPGAKARQETKEAKELGAAPARKARASASELKASQEKLFDDAKAKRAAAREAEKEAKRVAQETKGDKSPEARKKRLEAGRAWDKAATAADSAQRKWMKEHERWSKASGREEKAKMSPEQRKEERRINRVIKERG